jgi:hypothetical protein
MGVFLQAEKLQQQLLLGFRMGRILVDAFDRTDHDALGFIEMTDAFGAALGVDDVNLFTLGDGLVRTGRLTDIAVDAKGVDQECHSFKPKRLGSAEPRSEMQD